METYTLLPNSDHFLHLIAGLVVVVDTGSPASVGRRGALTLCGHTHLPAEGPSAVLDQLSEWIGRDVDWLIGMDLLGSDPVLFDRPGARVSFGAGAGRGEGTAIPLTLRFALPEIALGFRGAAVRAVVDTGAPVSYATPAAVAGSTPAGSASDFHSLAGRFMMPVYALEVDVGGRPFAGRFGVLPSQLMSLVHALGERWILGIEYFAGRRVLLDVPGRRLVDLG
jgi:hypothetical protein